MLYVLQGSLVAVFGVPDMGPACSEKHVPSYIKSVSLQLTLASKLGHLFGLVKTANPKVMLCGADRPTERGWR